jgi:rhodanese-related sulfurtransferase
LPKAADGAKTEQTVFEKAPVKPGAITRIDITAVFPLQQAGAVVLFDARPAIFYHMGRIPGARSWPAKRFESQLAEHKPVLESAARNGIPVVLYCSDRECADARAAAERIAAIGYSVSVLEGGFEEWKAAGLPTQ